MHLPHKAVSVFTMILEFCFVFHVIISDSMFTQNLEEIQCYIFLYTCLRQVFLLMGMRICLWLIVRGSLPNFKGYFTFILLIMTLDSALETFPFAFHKRIFLVTVNCFFYLCDKNEGFSLSYFMLKSCIFYCFHNHIVKNTYCNMLGSTSSQIRNLLRVISL